MTFYIKTLGCKVNLYESEIMREKMEEAGFLFSSVHPDIMIINTCSVTNVADKKSQKMVRHVKRNDPNTILVVAGCSSENKEEIYQQLDIDILLGNKDKSQIVDLITTYLKEHQKIVRFYHTRRLPFEDMSVNRFRTHTRAFLKIQDGCDNFCSYCIIPFVRGSIRFKDFQKALSEVQNLVNHGHKEIVLTGIHTGSYGMGTDYDLSSLLHEMSKIDGLERIRISSIEITDLNERFLEEFSNNPKICSHFHIPLQAGSDEILQKMNRKYDLNFFEQKLKQIREICKDVNITTDVIVGHPYETEELFLKTLDTVKRFGFSKIHAFPYSVREGTVAARMDSQVSEEEKKMRNRRLIQVSDQLEHEYAIQFLNHEMDVLIEKVEEDFSIGHTSNYLTVRISKKLEVGMIYSVRMKEVYENQLLGVLKEEV